MTFWYSGAASVFYTSADGVVCHGTSMHAVLERVVSQIAEELRGLDAESAQLHPNGRAHKWTAQQVVEHLILSYRVTTRALESRLAKGRLSRNRSRTYLQWSLQLMMISFGSFPRGVPALDETTPTGRDFPAMNGRELGDLLRQEVDAMDAALDRCRRKFGMERVAVHPWLGPLRVDQWRRFHVVHGMHHIPQIQSIIAQVAPERAVIEMSGNSLAEKLRIPAQSPLA
jgi:DinB superfamily